MRPTRPTALLVLWLAAAHGLVVSHAPSLRAAAPPAHGVRPAPQMCVPGRPSDADWPAPAAPAAEWRRRAGLGAVGRVLRRGGRALSAGTRALLLFVVMALPLRGGQQSIESGADSGLLSSFSPRAAVAAPFGAGQRSGAECAAELLAAQQQQTLKRPVAVKVVKYSFLTGVAGVGVKVALEVQSKRQQEETAEMADMLSSFITVEDLPPPPPPDAFGVPPAAADDLMGELFGGSSSLSPPPPPPPPPKAKGGLNLFQKRSAKALPTVDELLATEGQGGLLCATLRFAMLAPVDIMGAAAVALEGEEGSEGEVAFAQSVLEELGGARNESLAAGLPDAEVARLTEAMGCALLKDLVDGALDVVDKGKAAFAPEASKLCLFVRNAGFAASELGVAAKVGEVLYEGDAPNRRLEKLYRALLDLAGPELLAQMGLGGDDDDDEAAAGDEGVSGVSVDAVELVRPLLRIREAKSQRMMQQMMQSLMSKGDAGGGEKAMARSVEMLENLLDSGAVGPDDLQSLRGMMEQQMGMPVDELLERKDELAKDLPPEGQKLFALMERLFGKDGKGPTADAGAAADDAAAAAAAAGFGDADLDPNMEVKITERSLPKESEEVAAAPATGVKVRIKAKKPPTPEAAAQALKTAAAGAPTVAPPPAVEPPPPAADPPPAPEEVAADPAAAPEPAPEPAPAPAAAATPTMPPPPAAEPTPPPPPPATPPPAPPPAPPPVALPEELSEFAELFEPGPPAAPAIPTPAATAAAASLKSPPPPADAPEEPPSA